ncbi:Hypothetical protein ADU72_0243 [Pediococcus damnosus]|uniref:Mobile element protein n=1 Tax=Pediococcus damnosus TaxID=51663 RepID=A0ABM6A1S4_9LACO|nr:Hypothetical protein ADU72_0243 [Pediococcus damnosus]
MCSFEFDCLVKLNTSFGRKLTKVNFKLEIEEYLIIYQF